MLEAVVCDYTWSKGVASGAHSSAVSQGTQQPNSHTDTKVTMMKLTVGEGDGAKEERLSWDTGRKGNGLLLAEDRLDQLFIV